jgi:peptide/nickel transport system permease protein
MLEVLRTDFIKFARARLADRTVYFDHALRNTVPVITIIGLQFGSIFAFSIIVETVFSGGPQAPRDQSSVRGRAATASIWC